jgi:nucleotide-binding universal stress UspA family protein
VRAARLRGELDMIKRILVAVDGSAAGNAALLEAARLAELTGAQLRAVFVEDEMRFMMFPAVTFMEGGVAVPVPLPQDALTKVEAEVKAEATTLRNAFQAAMKAHPKAKGEFAAVRGGINAVLTQEGRAADLVVIGRRGKRPGEKQTNRPGPTTEAMVHDSLRPVLIVPPDPRAGGAVLFAFDGSKAAQRVAVMGAELAYLAHAPCHVVTVDDEPEGARATQHALLTYLAAYDLAPRAITAKGNVAAQILDQANAKGVGLIVMGAFGHSPLRELLFGSTTLSVVEGAPCPVLMMA